MFKGDLRKYAYFLFSCCKDMINFTLSSSVFNNKGLMFVILSFFRLIITKNELKLNLFTSFSGIFYQNLEEKAYLRSKKQQIWMTVDSYILVFSSFSR